MRQATSGVIVSSLILLAFVPAQAADLKVKASSNGGVAKARGHARATGQDDPPPQRVCEWVGPGGRALYRCNLG